MVKPGQEPWHPQSDHVVKLALDRWVTVTVTVTVYLFWVTVTVTATGLRGSGTLSSLQAWMVTPTAHVCLPLHESTLRLDRDAAKAQARLGHSHDESR